MAGIVINFLPVVSKRMQLGITEPSKIPQLHIRKDELALM